MCGCIGNCILARDPIRPNSAWKALGVIGPSRSDIKTCEDSPCSRCRRLSARISSPCIGWTLGEPFFALRTCSRPVAYVAIDSVGGRLLGEVADLLAEGTGTVINFGSLGGETSDIRLFPPRSLTLKGVVLDSWMQQPPDQRRADIALA